MEIKFRAWNTAVNKMLHFENPVGIADNENRYGLFMPSVEKKMYIGGKYELMPYTGLSDKNGNEIYKDDVLDGSYINPMTKEKVTRIYVVDFENGNFYARLIGKSPYGDSFLYFINKNCEVIGNRWNNPELLEVQNA